MARVQKRIILAHDLLPLMYFSLMYFFLLQMILTAASVLLFTRFIGLYFDINIFDLKQSQPHRSQHHIQFTQNGLQNQVQYQNTNEVKLLNQNLKGTIVKTSTEVRKAQKYHCLETSSSKMPDGDKLETELPYPLDNAERYFIYYCELNWCGGLTDRMKGMLISYIIASLTGRKFASHILIPSTRCSFSSFFDNGKITWDIDLDKLKGLSNMTIDMTNNPRLINKIKTMDFDKTFDTDVVYFTANLYYWNALVQNERYRSVLGQSVLLTEGQVYAQLIPRIFPLNKKLQDRLVNFLLRARQEKESRLVCGHIRRDKHPRQMEEEGGVQKILLFLKRFLTDSGDRVFIASDAIAVRELAYQMFQHQFINHTGPVMHIEDESDSENLCNGYELALVEQRILSECDILLLTLSGYGRLAAFVRNSDKDLYCYVHGTIKPCTTKELLDVYSIHT